MKKIIIIAAVVIVAAAAVFWLAVKKTPITPPFGQKAEEQKMEEKAAPAGTSGIGGQIFEQVQQNPAEKLPETNPFEKEINPYKSGYTNPFK